MRESPPSAIPVPHVTENEVNWEADDTELVFSRVANRTIAEQLNRLLLEQEMAKLRPYKEDEWLPHLPEGWTGEEAFKLLKNVRTDAIADTEDYLRLRDTPYPTIESIAEATEDRLAEAAAITGIDFSADSPRADKMGLDWKIPWTGEKPTTKQWSIIESHEKGHVLRPFQDHLNEHFMRGFDLRAVRMTEADHTVHKLDYQQGSQDALDRDPDETVDDFAARYLAEYLFTAPEIAERMSQLKNYFGFAGTETFTQAHLDYARAHYLEDTGMDNSMRLFMEGITPETEAAFLELINSSGI